MNDVYMAVGGGIGTVIGGFTGWFFRRRYEKASAVEKEQDAKGKEIDNEVKLADYYKEMLDDLGVRYESKYSDLIASYDKKFTDIVALYEQKARIMQDEINLLKNKNKMLMQENAAYRKRIKELEQ